MVAQLHSKQNMHLFLTKDSKCLRHTNKKEVKTDQRCSQTVVDANITQEHKR